MCEIAATAPLVIGYRTARMLRRRMAAERAGPPGVHADVAGEDRGLHAGGDGRGHRGTRPGRGRAGPDPGASSGARQRPAAVPRVSRPRGRPAAGQRDPARQRLGGLGGDPEDPPAQRLTVARGGGRPRSRAAVGRTAALLGVREVPGVVEDLQAAGREPVVRLDRVRHRDTRSRLPVRTSGMTPVRRALHRILTLAVTVIATSGCVALHWRGCGWACWRCWWFWPRRRQPLHIDVRTQ